MQRQRLTSDAKTTFLFSNLFNGAENIFFAIFWFCKTFTTVAFSARKYKTKVISKNSKKVGRLWLLKLL